MCIHVIKRLTKCKFEIGEKNKGQGVSINGLVPLKGGRRWREIHEEEKDQQVTPMD